MFNDGRRRLICLLRDYFDTLSHHYHNIPQVHDQRKRSLCNQNENILFSLKQFHFFAEAAAGVKGRLGDFPSNLKLPQVSREEIVNEWGDLIFSQMQTTLL